MLSNNGNYHADYGFFNLLQAIYTLIQITGGADTTHNHIGLENVPLDLQWLADLVLTSYNYATVIIMLNLLIAIVNSTYSEYASNSEALLLIEKYNIMTQIEKFMTRLELQVRYDECY